MPNPTPPTPLYFTLRLDVLSGLMKEVAEAAHQKRDGVSVREVRLLLLVREHPGLTISRLVALSFMEKTMVSKAITSLTRAGFIQRQIGQEDARQVALELTRKGKGVAERAHRYVIDATDALMSILSPKQRLAFDDTLGTLMARVIHQHSNGLDLLGQDSSTSGEPRARAATKRSAKPIPVSLAAHSESAAQARPMNIPSTFILPRKPVR